MARIVYAYFNDYDLYAINNLLVDIGVEFSVYKNVRLNKLPFSWNERCEITIRFRNGGTILFSPCIINARHFQEGYFAITDNSPASAQMFMLIKRHIKKTYMYSKENSFYYGTGIYHDWIDFKYLFPVLFEAETLNVDSNIINTIFNIILEEGFVIQPNNVRLRDINTIDLTFESFVIYSKSDRMIRTVLRKSIIYYEFGSECIFVYKSQKKNLIPLF